MRPQSIELFEKIYLGAIVIGLVNTVLSWGQVSAMLENPGLQSSGLGSGTLITSMLIGFLVPLLLWFFIARRASNVAKWIFVVLTALGLFGFLSSLANPMVPKGLVTIGGTIATGLQLYAAWLLFRPDAVAWLERKGADAPADTPANTSATLDGRPLE